MPKMPNRNNRGLAFLANFFCQNCQKCQILANPVGIPEFENIFLLTIILVLFGFLQDDKQKYFCT